MSPLARVRTVNGLNHLHQLEPLPLPAVRAYHRLAAKTGQPHKGTVTTPVTSGASPENRPMVTVPVKA
jgi:hypothetical protein